MPPSAALRLDSGTSGAEAEAEVWEDDVEIADDGGTEDGRAGNRSACCCVCMEPWTCSGAHRICCVPCGHVYGRSCLERWLQRCGNMSAKCPQCGERFEHKHITNLYAPGNLWDGCYHVQAKSHIVQMIHQRVVSTIRTRLVKLQSDILEFYRKSTAELISVLHQEHQKQLDHEVAAMVTTFVSIKEQMKKMVEQKATPTDLVEFMEQSYTQLPIPRRPPTDGQ